jgi:hypothetical protein
VHAAVRKAGAAGAAVIDVAKGTARASVAGVSTLTKSKTGDDGYARGDAAGATDDPATAATRAAAVTCSSSRPRNNVIMPLLIPGEHAVRADADAIDEAAASDKDNDATSLLTR